MGFSIDVAHLSADGTVLRTCSMRPRRVGRVVWSARSVIEADAGAFAHWGLVPGDVVEVAGGES